MKFENGEPEQEELPAPERSFHGLGALIEAAAANTKLPTLEHVAKGTYSSVRLSNKAAYIGLKIPKRKPGEDFLTPSQQVKIIEAVINSWPEKVAKIVPDEEVARRKMVRAKWREEALRLLQTNGYID